MSTPKIRFAGFTGDWEQRKLGDVIEDMYNGQTPSRFKDNYWGGEICWLSSGELNRGTVYQSKETITVEGQKSANLRLVPKGTFVMAITGLEAAGTRGNCAILGFDTTLNQSCMALFPNKDLLDTKFLFQWYKLVGERYGITYTQGTKQQSYNAEIISDLDICLPPVNEQQKIADVLGNLDNLIDLRQRKCEALKKVKKYMLQKMFPKKGEKVPEIRFAGFTGDWEQRTLGDIAEVKDSARIPNNEWMESGVPYIRASDITNEDLSGFLFISRDKYEFYKNRTGAPAENDVLFNGGGERGKAFLNREASPIYVQGGAVLYVRTSASDYLRGDYLVSYFSTKLAQQYIEVASAGGTMKHFTLKPAQNMPVALPSLEEQKKIGTYFSNLDKLIDVHQRKYDTLKEIKKYMLQNMFPKK